jgi:hypothetical protein
MINWKLLTGFSAFGAAVSLLAGIIGGNPFGVVALRMVLSAVLFAGLGFGVHLIFKKFFPDLVSAPTVEEDESGETVDIVIDEDLPMQAEEAAEPVPAGQQSPETEEAAVQTEEVEEAEELQAEDSGEEGELQSIPSTPEPDFESLDTLPDIDRFEVATEAGVDTAADTSPSSRSEIRNAQVEEVVRDQDPENLARAVRTFLKKDK